LFPTDGYLLSASAELAASWMGSQNEFQRYNTVFRFYQPLWAGVVFKVNSTLGLIRSPSERPVPVSELFFEGGINSLRGYNFRTIAPTIEAGGQPGGPLIPVSVGGNKELLTNWEVEFPVLSDAGLRGVVFFDAGNVYSEQQRIFDPQAAGRMGLLMSVGVGARLFTPMGPLRFEWGVPLTRRPIDEASRFEFTIGSFF
jgi:outer membrane protein insertion porin family